VETDLTYWDIKRTVQRMIPRQTVLVPIEDEFSLRRGRRSGYREYQLVPEGWKEYRRVLPEIGMCSALEVSLKAAACPMPLNLDVWDGKVCWYNCLYCFANHFRDSLYTNFFDQVPAGLRRVDLAALERELASACLTRGQVTGGMTAERAAFAHGVPVRIGVRFENFLPQERRDRVTLRTLQLLARLHWPVIIDTKSTLVAEDEYIQAMVDNPAGVVVQISLSGVDAALFKAIEPGAPSPQDRFEALGKLNRAGIRAVPRIEPFLPFLSDSELEMSEYIDRAHEAGVTHICWDAFSHSASSEVTRRLFMREGLDFDRMFLAASDSRLLTGILLWSMMEHFRAAGFLCSTYDDMNSIYNDDWLCCNVTGALKDPGANWTSTKAAERYIKEQRGRPVSWGEYSGYVLGKGGWLSEALRDQLYHLWNGDGDPAYSLAWLGVVPVGRDQSGLLWSWAGDNPNLVRAMDWIEGEHERLA